MDQVAYVIYIEGRGYSGLHNWFYKNIVSAKFYVYEKSALNACKKLKKRFEKVYVKRVSIVEVE